MYEPELEHAGEDASETMERNRKLDFDEDQVDVRDESESDGEIDDEYGEGQRSRIENAELDNDIDEFVDVVNGRNLDALSELLASDADAEFLAAGSREEVTDGFGDLLMRNPTLLVTRADLGSDPLVALWTFDYDADQFDPFGFLVLEMSEAAEGLIQRISYVEEVPDPDELVIETPERADLPEWEEWVGAR